MSQRTIGPDGRDEPKRMPREHSERIRALQSRGWGYDPEHGQHITHNFGTDKQPYKCVYLVGLLWSVPRSAFLSIDCGRVLLVQGEDMTFDEFIAVLDGKAERKALVGQRGFSFDED